MKTTIEQLIGMMGFDDFSVSFDAETNRYSILINEDILEKALADFVMDFNQVVKLIARKNNSDLVVIDINNYRKQRHDLILEIARAAARKSVANKEEIVLPPMNAFERRLIHMELAGRPDLKTESVGEGKERSVIVKPI